jgi:VWFA-related protein
MMDKRFPTTLKVSLLCALVFLLSSFSSHQEVDLEPDTINVSITQVDASQFPEVTVYVSVTDLDGEPVAVDPAGISLEESGEVISADQIIGMGEISSLATLLVMDVSGSMNGGGKLDAAKAAAQAYVQQMGEGDKAGLLVFNTSIDLVQSITGNRNDLIESINGLSAWNDTVMYDALIQAVEILEPVGGRKAIIVLTDGLDNRSIRTPEEVIQAIGPAGLSISTIGLGDPSHGKGAQTALDEAALISLAEKGGGVYGYADNEVALSGLYERYGRALQAEYQLTYTSPSTVRDGVNRSLMVSFQSVAAQEAVVLYNPGGIVPETAAPASWSLFLVLFGGLLLLLAAPGFVRGGAKLLANARNKKGGNSQGQTRIRFTD